MWKNLVCSVHDPHDKHDKGAESVFEDFNKSTMEPFTTFSLGSLIIDVEDCYLHKSALFCLNTWFVFPKEQSGITLSNLNGIT